MEFGTGITIKLDAIYSGEWDFRQVRDSIKRVMKKRSAPKLPKIALISHDAEDMRCLLNSSKSPFVGIMENGDGILRANFDCASTFYAASKAFTSGKVDLALKLSKTTDVKVVSTTMAQAGRCQRAEISLDCTKAISKVHSEILYRWCLFWKLRKFPTLAIFQWLEYLYHFFCLHRLQQIYFCVVQACLAQLKVQNAFARQSTCRHASYTLKINS